MMSRVVDDPSEDVCDAMLTAPDALQSRSTVLTNAEYTAWDS